MLWLKPQALMWERYGQQLEVALYVRNLGQVEEPGSPINLGTLVRQQSDSLGLTTPGMRANRWKVDRPAEGIQGQAAPATTRRVAKAGPAARERWKVIDGGAAS